MREILFRGKRTDNKQWVEGFYTLIGEENPNAYIIKNNGRKIRVCHKSIGQYTGLTDKNGTKIFEGDIVKATTTDGRHSDAFEIGIGFCEETESEVLSMGVYCIIDGTAVVFPCNDEYKDLCEVIGNIHDNPELLKGGSEQ